MNGKPRVVILGGGFGGMYAALEFERALARGTAVDVTLVNHDNFFLFTPMLHEVAASDLDITICLSSLALKRNCWWLWTGRWMSSSPRISSTSEPHVPRLRHPRKED